MVGAEPHKPTSSLFSDFPQFVTVETPGAEKQSSVFQLPSLNVHCVHTCACWRHIPKSPRLEDIVIDDWVLLHGTPRTLKDQYDHSILLLGADQLNSDTRVAGIRRHGRWSFDLTVNAQTLAPVPLFRCTRVQAGAALVTSTTCPPTIRRSVRFKEDPLKSKQHQFYFSKGLECRICQSQRRTTIMPADAGHPVLSRSLHELVYLTPICSGIPITKKM